MSLQLPTFQDPTRATPIANAYAWISNLVLDFRANNGQGGGSLMVGINASAADAAAIMPAVAGVSVTLGQTLVPANPVATPPAPAVTFPTFAQLMTDPDFATAFGTIREKLYTALLQHPAFAGATEVA